MSYIHTILQILFFPFNLIAFYRRKCWCCENDFSLWSSSSFLLFVFPSFSPCHLRFDIVRRHHFTPFSLFHFSMPHKTHSPFSIPHKTHFSIFFKDEIEPSYLLRQLRWMIWMIGNGIVRAPGQVSAASRHDVEKTKFWIQGKGQYVCFCFGCKGERKLCDILGQ